MATYYQTLSLNDLTLFSYIPNIIIPILIFSHFYLNITYHSILFFLIGLSLDCLNPPLFGTYTLSFMLLSYLITTIKNHIDLHIFANKLAMITICNVLFYLIYHFLISIVYKQDFISLLISFFISLISNTILSIIIIGLLDFLRMLKLDPTHE